MSKMVSLCFPYGSPITCVCDPRGHVYNCFPTDTKGGKMGSFHGGGDQRRQAELGGKIGAGRGMVVEDQRTEIVLATTALVAVVALFLSFLIYRLEKYLVSNGFQLPLFHRCSKSNPTLRNSSSASAQTDPVVYCYSHSQTVVGITRLSSLAPPAQPSNVYPTLPQRRYSYSPDSAVEDSARPSMSSTLPLPRSRSRSSPYENDSGDQVSTPIELRELHYIDSRGSEEGTQASGEERFQGQEEEEVHFTEMYNNDNNNFTEMYNNSQCSSQQPLLDFMRLAEMDQHQPGQGTQ